MDYSSFAAPHLLNTPHSDLKMSKVSMYLNLPYFNPRHTISFNGMLIICTLSGCKIVAQEDIETVTVG